MRLIMRGFLSTSDSEILIIDLNCEEEWFLDYIRYTFQNALREERAEDGRSSPMQCGSLGITFL